MANVIAYRPRMAVRDAAKALGFSPGQQDAWSKQIDGWKSVVAGDQGDPAAHDVPPPVVALAEELMGAPRHLGIHSGGMVLTERPIGEVCPIERARMDRRTVLQWDKDACESMGLVKFDLLGLGMLGALDHMMRLVAEHLGRAVGPRDDAQGGARRSTTCCAGPTRSGCSRSRAAPRSARCRGCGRASSTTSPSRSP